MPSFLATIGSALAAPAVKLGLGLMLLAGVLGLGFVWGETSATRIAAEAAAKDADARVAAVQKSDQAVVIGYLGQLSAARAHGDALAASLAQAQGRLAANTAQAKKDIIHAVPLNSACDLSTAALGVLGAQPARQ